MFRGAGYTVVRCKQTEAHQCTKKAATTSTPLCPDKSRASKGRTHGRNTRRRVLHPDAGLGFIVERVNAGRIKAQADAQPFFDAPVTAFFDDPPFAGI